MAERNPSTVARREANAEFTSMEHQICIELDSGAVSKMKKTQPANFHRRKSISPEKGLLQTSSIQLRQREGQSPRGSHKKGESPAKKIGKTHEEVGSQVIGEGTLERDKSGAITKIPQVIIQFDSSKAAKHGKPTEQRIHNETVQELFFTSKEVETNELGSVIDN